MYMSDEFRDAKNVETLGRRERKHIEIGKDIYRSNTLVACICNKERQLLGYALVGVYPNDPDGACFNIENCETWADKAEISKTIKNVLTYKRALKILNT